MVTRWQVTKAVRASDLPSASRLIMLTLADVAEVGTAEIPAQFTPSISVLARETGLAKSTTKEHLSGLELSGWIKRSRPDQKSQWYGARTRYQLTIPESMTVPGVGQEPAQVGQDMAQGGPADGPGVGRETDRGRPGDGHLETDHSDQGQIFSDHSPSATPQSAKPKTKKITDDDPDFAAFWKAYPRKTDKGHARTAWASALKNTDPADIISGAEKFAAWCARSNTEKRFIPHPSTWLNGERWADEADNSTPRSNGHQPYRNPTDMSVYYEGL